MTNIVTKSKIFKIYNDTYTFRKKEVVYEYATLFDDTTTSVMVAAKNKNNQYILVEQYWPASQKKGYVFPGGKIDKGETPEEAAIRELAEETGLLAQKITPITELDILPKYIKASTKLFLAEDLINAKGFEGDEQFEMETKYVTINELKQKIKEGALNDSRTLALALLLIVNIE